MVRPLIKNKLKGFTLTELLIVITIIGFLTTLLALAYVSQLKKARDAERKAQIQKIKIAFEDYFADWGCYPSDPAIFEHCGSKAFTPWLEKVYCDSLGNFYRVVVEDDECPDYYAIYTNIEYLKDHQLLANECYSGCVIGTENYNFVVYAEGLESESVPGLPGNELTPTPTPVIEPTATPTDTIPTSTPTPAIVCDTLELQVSQNPDDGRCWDDNGDGYDSGLTSNTIGRLLGGHSYGTWNRFTNVAIPQGATINSAVLSWRAAAEYSANLSISVAANAADNPSSPASSTDFRGRPLTSAGVEWNINTNWLNNNWYSPPDIGEVIQEIVDRPGWSSGNSLLIITKDNGTAADSLRGYRAVEGSPTSASKLEVDYCSEQEFSVCVGDYYQMSTAGDHSTCNGPVGPTDVRADCCYSDSSCWNYCTDPEL
ncbi:MAG: prepilin-type N-terminal cleavage/methylation domain-containing protein [Candidatus Shapirobacteria bacterium]